MLAYIPYMDPMGNASKKMSECLIDRKPKEILHGPGLCGASHPKVAGSPGGSSAEQGARG